MNSNGKKAGGEFLEMVHTEDLEENPVDLSAYFTKEELSKMSAYEKQVNTNLVENNLVLMKLGNVCTCS